MAQGVDVKFQFVTDPGIGSTIIRYWRWQEYSHVDLVLPNGQLLGARSDTILGIPPGVRIRPQNYKKFTRVLVATMTVTPEQAASIYAAAFRQVGKPYAYEGIFDFIWHDNDPPPSEDTPAWICSTLVGWLTLQAGCPILNPKVDLNRIAPGDLLMSPVLRY